mmetsp:Transcript_8257/g.17611  ORF Transcript_8257/g.17611 Transcript_8257/m.17611 type:complete len:179 (+) Transcript_8257:3462-3998(+)
MQVCSPPVSSPLIDNLCGNGCAPEQSFWMTAAAQNTAPVQQQQQQLEQARVGSPTTTSSLMEKPKRALSAYNCFFREERKKLLEALPDRESRGIGKTPRNSHGKMGFKEMAHLISRKWKAITPEEKAPFAALAKQDTLRYRKEMELWKLNSQNVAGVVTHTNSVMTIPTLPVSFFTSF